MPKKGYTKPENERRAKRVHVLFTEAELAQVQASAQAAGLTVSAYLRSTALGHRPKAKPSRVASELVRELNHVGVNLNQLVRSLHRGRSPLDEDVRLCLQALQAALEKVAT